MNKVTLLFVLTLWSVSSTAHGTADNHLQLMIVDNRVLVIGGGNTAIDAARSARRDGALVTLLYRRSQDRLLL